MTASQYEPSGWIGIECSLNPSSELKTSNIGSRVYKGIGGLWKLQIF